MPSFRFSILAGIKAFTRLTYSFNVEIIGKEIPWDRIKLAILLNHTSLFEPIFSGALPWNFLRSISKNGTVPIAAETIARPFVGRIFETLVPHVIPLTRKRDDSWDFFISHLDKEAVVMFMPEGRMKRPGGLDKHGNPMTVRGGIVDLLMALKTGPMVIGYSGGLHHIQAPGDRLPRLFKKISIKYEYLEIEDYLRSFPQTDERALRRAIVADLEARRDRHCGKE